MREGTTPALMKAEWEGRARLWLPPAPGSRFESRLHCPPGSLGQPLQSLCSLTVFSSYSGNNKGAHLLGSYQVQQVKVLEDAKPGVLQEGYSVFTELNEIL